MDKCARYPLHPDALHIPDVPEDIFIYNLLARYMDPPSVRPTKPRSAKYPSFEIFRIYVNPRLGLL